MKEIAEYDSQFKYWNSRSKEENEIYPKYYETNIDLEIPGIQHGYLLIGGSYVGEIFEDAVFEIIDITGKIYGTSDVLARELCEKLNEQCLEEETPNNQEILLYIDKVDEFMQQKYAESKRTVLIANQKKLDNWLQSRKEEYLLTVKDTSELDELKEKYAIEGDFRQKIALKKQIEILEEQKQKMVRAFHDEMSTLEEEAVNMQKQFAEDILVHGDNLLALKALERDYAGKIKCVYIDPPYNTGNAFEHYDDDVEHSLWLNMIYKRVQILHKLLSKDGTLWMSIDSTEGHYLKVMCDEIFGRSNFVSDITYEKSNVTGLGQGGAIFNTGEKLLVYKKETVELNEVLATEKLTKKTMQRYRKYIKSEGRRELVDEFESASNGLPVKIYKHTGYEIGDISLKNFEARESEIRAQYYQFFDTIYRTYVVQQENEFQNALMSRMEKNSLYSVEYVPSRGRNEGKQTTLFYHNGELCAWLKDTAFLEKKDVVKTTKLSNVWKNDDIPKADLGNEGGVAFPRSKKPEKLIERILLMATNEGDLVLDSFLGSGTTAAVAHKMRRRYIGIELGDHCYTHCKKRLDRVIDGKDRGGVTNTYDCQGGGGYKFYELAEPLLVKNKVLPVYQINPSYTWDMVCEAICKIEGFTYEPYGEFQGHSSENRFIHITEEFVNTKYAMSIMKNLGDKQSLLIYCKKNQADMILPENVEVKKIPKDLLDKCNFESEVQE